jgi:hypothetical protein
MKIYISNYRNHWLSPYTVLKKVCFWEKNEDVFYDLEDTGTGKYVKWVNRLEPVCTALHRLLDIVHPQIEYIKIDRYDTWSMDHTLGAIALPMLKQLRENKHGAPHVEDRDVPKGLGLRSTEAPAKENKWDTDANHFKRWDWVLDEMIFAFEHKLDDSWQDAFRSGKIDHKTVACEWDETGRATMYKWEDGPDHTYKCDYKGIEKVEKRIQNGFCLFGKYYQNLWD